MICKTCGGRKIIIGDGYMEHKCLACNGKGYIKEIIPIIDNVVEEKQMPIIEINPPKISVADLIDQAIKRRGRPKKIVE